jgi:glycosyltransferase involved in cell wall biosynthesis
VTRPLGALYICYLGLREPLVQTQVLPYLDELARAGHRLHLLTFEPRRWDPGDAERHATVLAARGIRWHHLRYHKAPSVPATALDIALGAFFAARLVRKERLDVVHARAQVALAMALPVRRATGCRLVFDLRALLAEEYADAGIWRTDSPVFRLVKRVENVGLRVADQVVVLTDAVRTQLVRQALVDAARTTVIPCCVDVSRFDVGSTARAPYDLVYAGSVDGLYLLEEMADFYGVFASNRPESRLRIFTMAAPGDTAHRLRSRGLRDAQFCVASIAPENLPAQLSGSAAGLSFRRPGLAQIAASPTKIPEYLAAGLPVVATSGVGDCDELLAGRRVGVVVLGRDRSHHERAFRELSALLADPVLSDRCRSAAAESFDLRKVGGARYRRVYDRLGDAIAARGVG